MRPNEIDDLLVRYLDHALSEDETARLATELESNADAREQLRGMAAQAIAVAEAGRCAEARLSSAPTQRLVALPDQPATAQTKQASNERSRMVFWLKAAASLTVMGAALTWWTSQTPQEEMTVVQLHGAVRWTSSEGQAHGLLKVGDRLPMGSLELEGSDALAAVRWADGSAFTLHGRSEAAFSAPEQGRQLRLRYGTFTAAVAKQLPGRPLRIFTPTAEMVVLGTVFSLEPDPVRTSLEVAEGLVKMRRLADGQEAAVAGAERLEVTLDKATELSPQPQGNRPAAWRSDLTQFPAGSDGLWLPPSALRPLGALQSQPYVAGRQEDGSVLVHHGIVYAGGVGLALAGADSELVVKVRTAEDTTLQIMLIAKKPDGSFAGNYEASVPEVMAGAEGTWKEFRLPLSAFRSPLPDYPETINGLIVSEILVSTYTWPVGLEVGNLQLRPAQP